MAHPRPRVHRARSPPTSRRCTPTPTRSSRCSPTSSRTRPSTAAPTAMRGHRRGRRRRRSPSPCATPARGSRADDLPRVFTQVLPARPRPAHRHRPRALDQPGPGGGPRRAAHGRRPSWGRAARSGSPSPSTPSSASSATEPIGDGPSLTGEHRRHHARRHRRASRPTRARASPPRPPSTTLRALDQELLGKRSALSSLKAKLGRPRRPTSAGRSGRRSTGPATPLEAALSGPARPSSSADARARAARGRAARPHRGRRPGDGAGHLHLVTQAMERLEDVFVGHGLHRRRGPGGRDRLAQLRRPQLPARPPGPRHVRHALRRARRARLDAAAHPHLAGAGAGDDRRSRRRAMARIASRVVIGDRRAPSTHRAPEGDRELVAARSPRGLLGAGDDARPSPA